MQASNGFYGSSNVVHRRGNHRARDTVKTRKGWINVNYKTRVAVIAEAGARDEGGNKSAYHCHLTLPEGRTNILLMLDPEAPNRAARVLYTFHSPERRPANAPPLIHFDPTKLSKRARNKIYKTVETLLGSRAKENLRIVPSRERPYSLLNALPYRL